MLLVTGGAGGSSIVGMMGEAAVAIGAIAVSVEVASVADLGDVAVCTQGVALCGGDEGVGLVAGLAGQLVAAVGLLPFGILFFFILVTGDATDGDGLALARESRVGVMTCNAGSESTSGDGMVGVDVLVTSRAGIVSGLSDVVLVVTVGALLVSGDAGGGECAMLLVTRLAGCGSCSAQIVRHVARGALGVSLVEQGGGGDDGLFFEMAIGTSPSGRFGGRVSPVTVEAHLVWRPLFPRLLSVRQFDVLVAIETLNGLQGLVAVRLMTVHAGLLVMDFDGGEFFLSPRMTGETIGGQPHVGR